MNKSLQSTSKKLKERMLMHPEEQINYRLAHKKKRHERFGGEQRFEWCLNQVGLKENIDYVYNKSVKVYDKYNKKFRWFYPDFLLWGKYIFEIDGFYHNSIKAKKYDKERSCILQSKPNNFAIIGRYTHDYLLNNKNLHHVINDILFVKENFN